MTWTEQVDANATIAEVAAALGMAVRRNRAGPCLACGNDVKGRGAVRMHGRAWVCSRCNVGGSQMQLVALAIHGVKKPDTWHDVRAWFAARGWCEPYGASTWTPPPPRPPEPELPYPDGLAAWWAATVAVDKDAGTSAYWAARGFGPLHGAARAVVARTGHPSWWPAHWRQYRLAIAAYDAAGIQRSMHARCTDEGEAERWGKTRWPKDCRSTRLLFADPWLALPMLQGESIPQRVIVVEGATDFLALCSVRPPGWAILGAAAGGFAALADVRWPTGCTIVSGVDDDEAGRAYHRQIVAAVPSARRLPAVGKDWAEDVRAKRNVAAYLEERLPVPE